MKKNKMMRIASFLLVAVLMSTCAISGTFAKYVTADSATDDARVAKWGITVAVSGNLFGKDYSAKGIDDTGNEIVAATSTSVSATDKNVVAPGTKNEVGMKISISGKPEVAYSITANENGVPASDIFLAKGTYGVMVPAHGLNAATDFANNNYYVLDGTTYEKATAYNVGPYYELIDKVSLADNYYPITWTVTNTGNATQIAATKNLKEIANSIYTGICAGYTGICAGSHLANKSADASYTITWAWAFEDQNDQADTILGHLQDTAVKVVKLSEGKYVGLVKNTDYCLDVAFGISVTVTQID